ncbi:flagellar basal-body rod protein FlgF [Saccharospirillum impatiens]|uniref:flagellar basal-body rod protein FlgF n=1 Tax=Saccharospirillum impatiens TaxID=169438 RepID=UPI0003FEE4C5|nr:flagellar basal-body rod protein FlgF [Saccharospirillum impatiens]
MDRALYIAMTGAKNNMMAQTSHSNNLANASTTGFRADWAQARAMPVYGEHYPTRAYSMTERPATDFNDGPLIQTGNELDVAIAGDGFLSVLDAQGNEAYTRRGDLAVTPLGELINSVGQPVLGNGGPIVLPPYEKLEIASDGTISIRPAGAGPNEMLVIDALKVVNPDLQNLDKGTDGLFRPREGDQVLPADPALQVASGFVEGSNVNAVAELTNILAINRQYELQIKMMKASDDVSQAAEQLLRLN